MNWPQSLTAVTTPTDRQVWCNDCGAERCPSDGGVCGESAVGPQYQDSGLQDSEHRSIATVGRNGHPGSSACRELRAIGITTEMRAVGVVKITTVELAHSEGDEQAD